MRRIHAVLAVLSVSITGLLFSGCASSARSPAARPHDTVILGGLFESRPGAFDQQTSTGIPLNSDRPSRSKRMSGDKISFLWGLFTYRDQ